MRAPIIWAILLSLAMAGCAGSRASRRPSGACEHGRASWYGGHFHGRETASGETYDKEALTAAHPRLPFGTVVCVTNKKNGWSVNVRINDRGPHAKGRIIDVSEAAARQLGMLGDGVVPVKVQVLKRPRKRKAH
jgi:rare lipoprotein A